MNRYKKNTQPEINSVLSGDDSNNNNNNMFNKLCAWRHNMPRPSPPPWAPKRRPANAT